MPDLTYYGMTFQKRGAAAVVLVPNAEVPLAPPLVGQHVSVSADGGVHVSGVVDAVEYQLAVSRGPAATNRTLVYNVTLV